MFTRQIFAYFPWYRVSGMIHSKIPGFPWSLLYISRISNCQFEPNITRISKGKTWKKWQETSLTFFFRYNVKWNSRIFLLFSKFPAISHQFPVYSGLLNFPANSKQSRVFWLQDTLMVWSTWPIFRAIRKTLKNEENKSKAAPWYDQPISRNSSSTLPVTW